MEVAQIVITSLTLSSTTLTPLIIAGAYFISHIRKSKCCFGNEVELNESPRENKKLKDELKKVEPYF